MDKNEIALGLGQAIAYEEGYKAGKQVATEQIFADIDKLHLHVSNEYEARAYEELKRKHGIKQ
jgi:hypothetical protein